MLLHRVLLAVAGAREGTKFFTELIQGKCKIAGAGDCAEQLLQRQEQATSTSIVEPSPCSPLLSQPGLQTHSGQRWLRRDLRPPPHRLGRSPYVL